MICHELGKLILYGKIGSFVSNLQEMNQCYFQHFMFVCFLFVCLFVCFCSFFFLEKNW